MDAKPQAKHSGTAIHSLPSDSLSMLFYLSVPCCLLCKGKMAMALNCTRHLSGKLELYFRHQRGIAMQSFGIALMHSKHHAFPFHCPIYQAVLTAMGTTKMMHTFQELLQEELTHTGEYHEKNELCQVRCVGAAQR